MSRATATRRVRGVGTLEYGFGRTWCGRAPLLGWLWSELHAAQNHAEKRDFTPKTKDAQPIFSSQCYHTVTAGAAAATFVRCAIPRPCERIDSFTVIIITINMSIYALTRRCRCCRETFLNYADVYKYLLPKANE